MSATHPTYCVPLGNGLDLLFPLLIDGVATPIAGWTGPTLIVTANLSEPSFTPLCTLTLGDGVEIYDAEGWEANCLGATHFLEAGAGPYSYIFRATDPDGHVQTLETGTINPPLPCPASSSPPAKRF